MKLFHDGSKCLNVILIVCNLPIVSTLSARSCSNFAAAGVAEPLGMSEADAMRRRMQLTLSAEVPLLSVICFVRPTMPASLKAANPVDSLDPPRSGTTLSASNRSVKLSPLPVGLYRSLTTSWRHTDRTYVFGLCPRQPRLVPNPASWPDSYIRLSPNTNPSPDPTLPQP